MQREPETLAAYLGEVETARGLDARLDRAVDLLKRSLANPDQLESRARLLVEQMAVLLQGSLLLRHGDPAVADLFCASRVAGERGHAFGTLEAGPELKSVIARHRPRL